MHPLDVQSERAFIEEDANFKGINTCMKGVSCILLGAKIIR